jgi:hypothetical protein
LQQRAHFVVAVAGLVVGAPAVLVEPPRMVRNRLPHEVVQLLHGLLGLRHQGVYGGGVLLQFAHAHLMRRGGIGGLNGGQPARGIGGIKRGVECLKSRRISREVRVHGAHGLPHGGRTSGIPLGNVLFHWSKCDKNKLSTKVFLL